MRKKRFILPGILVTDYAAEGKSLARIDGKVIFIEGAVPGDTVDVFITKNKKDWAEGKATNFKAYSKERVIPFCKHFGICGGCKWQMLPYQKQLEYKQQETEQNLKRIAKIPLPAISPILGSLQTIHYRNKLEFTFSNKRYLLNKEISTEGHIEQNNALGYHAPRVFDKIIDIHECFLMDDVNNEIRNKLRDFVVEQNYPYYDIKEHSGWLRNIIIRYCSTGQLMINVVFGYEDAEQIKVVCTQLLKMIPSITTLLYTINVKWNDSINDLEPKIFFGPGYVMEKMNEFHFKISPKSFFQTNTLQATKLYTVVSDYAGLTGKETVYDLYCGTGSIGIFVSGKAKKIIGVDVIPEAIANARENAAINDIGHAEFFAGDVITVCTSEFFETNGYPDIIITDPPRAGMHDKLVKKLLEIAAPKIVYVSCNVATQARDIALLSELYEVKNIQPLDMFPHTHHIECVCLLELKPKLHL